MTRRVLPMAGGRCSGWMAGCTGRLIVSEVGVLRMLVCSRCGAHHGRALDGEGEAQPLRRLASWWPELALFVGWWLTCRAAL